MIARRWLAVLVVATALSMGQPAAAEQVGPLVADIDRVEEASVTDGSPVKQVTVDCPEGKRVYGPAGRINGGTGNVVLDEVIPNSALTSVTVTAYEVAPDDSWSIIAYAMCGDAIPNLQRVSDPSVLIASENPKTASPTCPGSTRLYGLGAQITGGVGNVVLDDLTPAMSLTGVNVTAYETGIYAGNWHLTGYAICADPVATMQRVAISEPAPPAPADGVSPKAATTPNCPFGTTVHGGGATITGAGGDVSLDEWIPMTGNVLATGYIIPGQAANWRITAYAICAS